MHRNSAPL